MLMNVNLPRVAHKPKYYEICCLAIKKPQSLPSSYQLDLGEVFLPILDDEEHTVTDVLLCIQRWRV